MSRQKTPLKTSYHHGDLQRRLLEEAIAMVRRDGIEALSLRKLADQVGVSQTALYHHFGDKQALLCAIGEEGIRLFSRELEDAQAKNASATRLEIFVTCYVRFAIANPELYELMFGRTTWRNGVTDSFLAATHGAFRRYVEMISVMQAGNQLSSELNPLRLAQVIWGTLHGLCRMYNDGLSFTQTDVEEIGEYALWLLRQVQTPKSS